MKVYETANYIEIQLDEETRQKIADLEILKEIEVESDNGILVIFKEEEEDEEEDEEAEREGEE